MHISKSKCFYSLINVIALKTSLECRSVIILLLQLVMAEWKDDQNSQKISVNFIAFLVESHVICFAFSSLWQGVFGTLKPDQVQVWRYTLSYLQFMSVFSCFISSQFSSSLRKILTVFFYALSF